MEESEAKLIAEQLGRLTDAMNSRLSELKVALEHHVVLDAEKHLALDQKTGDLKAAVLDHETRIRAATEGVTQFKMFSGLANAGSSVLAVSTFIKSLLGG